MNQSLVKIKYLSRLSQFYYHMSHAEKCVICHGDGKINLDNRKKKCHGCEGKGWVTIHDKTEYYPYYPQPYYDPYPTYPQPTWTPFTPLTTGTDTNVIDTSAGATTVSTADWHLDTTMGSGNDMPWIHFGSTDLGNTDLGNTVSADTDSINFSTTDSSGNYIGINFSSSSTAGTDDTSMFWWSDDDKRKHR